MIRWYKQESYCEVVREARHHTGYTAAPVVRYSSRGKVKGTDELPIVVGLKSESAKSDQVATLHV